MGTSSSTTHGPWCWPGIVGDGTAVFQTVFESIRKNPAMSFGHSLVDFDFLQSTTGEGSCWPVELPPPRKQDKWAQRDQSSTSLMLITANRLSMLYLVVATHICSEQCKRFTQDPNFEVSIGEVYPDCLLNNQTATTLIIQVNQCSKLDRHLVVDELMQ